MGKAPPLFFQRGAEMKSAKQRGFSGEA